MSDEILTEEVYWYDSINEAIEDMQKMMSERACMLIFDVDNKDPQHVKMTVKVGEAR